MSVGRLPMPTLPHRPPQNLQIVVELRKILQVHVLQSTCVDFKWRKHTKLWNFESSFASCVLSWRSKSSALVARLRESGLSG